MSPELEAALYRDFPQLYRHGLLDGCFRCDDGWEPLIRDLSEKIVRDCAVYDDEPEEDRPYVEQVKEKFGGLRFYMSRTSSKMEATIQRYEDKSMFVCEICGDRGRRQRIGNGYWIKTVCEKHERG